MLQQPFAIPALIFAILAIPLFLGIIPPNRLYGLRTAQTLSGERVWYAANRFSGMALLLASWLYLGIATLWPHAPGQEPAVWLLHLVSFAGSLFAAVFASSVYARKL